MSEKTKISWCDSTINFWSGCAKVSAGCANCYAEEQGKRFPAFGKWGKNAPRRLHESAFKEAIRLNKKPCVCDGCGEAFAAPTLHSPKLKPGMIGASECCAGYHRRRIFSLSLGDINDEEVSLEWKARAWDIIRQCSSVTWIICSKRWDWWHADFDSMRRLSYSPGGEGREWIDRWYNGEAPKNVILLASVENQEMAEKRIPELLGIPAVCRGLSLEPLLGPVDLTAVEGLQSGFNCLESQPGIDWLIIGGESGHKARPCNIEWIRSLVQQGKDAGIATFVKQLGSNVHGDPRDGFTCDYGVNEMFRARLKHSKGGKPAEWPEDLRVREFPTL